MQNDQPELPAEIAVEKAFEYFDKFVARGAHLDSVLLEELEPVDGGWIVSIGFNGKRQETSEPAAVGAIAALSGFGTKTTKTVREIRHIHLDKQGRFEKMN